MERNFTRKVLIVVSITFGGVLLFVGLNTAFHLLLLIFAGILIAVYFRRIAELLEDRTKLNYRQSLSIVIIATLGVITAFFRGLGARVTNQVTELRGDFPSLSQSISNKLGQTPGGNRIIDQGKQLQSQGGDSQLMGVVTSFFSSTFGALGDLYIILIISIYFTATPKLYKKTFLNLFPASRRKKTELIMDEMYVTLGKWILGQMMAMVIIAAMTWIGFSIIGMPYALVFALLAGALNFIPNFGPLIAMIPTALVALTISPMHALGVVIVTIIAQNIEGEFITPLIQQKMVNLPPAYIILFQVFMGISAGGIGIVLATPLLAVLMVMVQKVYVKPVADKE